MPHVPLNLTGFSDQHYSNITPALVVCKSTQTVPSLAPLFPQYPAPPQVNLPGLSTLFPHMQHHHYLSSCSQQMHQQQRQQLPSLNHTHGSSGNVAYKTREPSPSSSDDGASISAHSTSATASSPTPYSIAHPITNRFHCHWEGCGRDFKTAWHLQSHTRRHTKLKQFPCESCLAHFTRKHDLIRHTRTVHAATCGELQFNCRYCNKEFGRTDSLKRHSRICKKAETKQKDSILSLEDLVF